LEQAQADITLIVQQLEQQYPDTNSGWRAILIPLHTAVTGDIRFTLLILLGAVGLVLLVACANVANLLLARATARAKEISIRAALGAGGGRLARQHLTEAALLSFMGGCLGLFGAYWGVEALKALGPEGLPRLAEIHVDPRILAFSFSLSLLSGLVFGMTPALSIARTHPSTSLREGGRASSLGPSRRSTQSTLVVAQVALTLMLTIGAGLLVRTFMRVLEVDPGFHTDRLLTMNVFLTGANYDTIPKQRAFVSSALEQLGALPGVASVSVVSAVPFGETSSNLSFQIAGREAPADQLPRADYRSIDPNYFRTMGIPLLQGRVLSITDDEDAPKVVLINETMARRFWPGEDPIGQSIHWVFQGRGTGSHTIVGVVGDVQSFGLDAEEQPAVYAPFAQRSFSWLRWKTFVIRTAAAPLALAPTARDALLMIEPDLPVFGITSMDQLMTDSLAARRFVMLVLTVFAILSLVLSSVGIYGVISYGTQQRLSEFAVRMALGASRGSILAIVLRRGLSLGFMGIGIGLVGALILSRHIETLLFNIEATDPSTFVSVSVLFTAVSLLACYLPASRATRVDPMQTLRQE
jgi:putative ABC transport system permease protein